MKLQKTINYTLYLDVVIYNQTKLEFALSWFEKQGLPLNPNDYQKINKYSNARLQCPFVVVCFSALFLEAYINDYARRLSSANYTKNYLDKMDFISKWVIIPKLFAKSEFDRAGQAFEFLTKLNRLRNGMVHYKTREFNAQIDDLNVQEFKDINDLALKCLNGIKIVLMELLSIKEDIETRKWIAYIDKSYGK